MSKEKKDNPKHDEFYEAPESGTVISEDNPSSPGNLGKDDAPDSISEAPESGTMREK